MLLSLNPKEPSLDGSFSLSKKRNRGYTLLLLKQDSIFIIIDAIFCRGIWPYTAPTNSSPLSVVKNASLIPWKNGSNKPRPHGQWPFADPAYNQTFRQSLHPHTWRNHKAYRSLHLNNPASARQPLTDNNEN